MTIHHEGFKATRERVYQFRAVEHQYRSRNPVRENEQSVDDLRAAVESLQQIVSELLLTNQNLRMALDRGGEVVATSSVTGSSSGEFPNS